MLTKGVTVEIKTELAPYIIEICTDFKIFESIFFHLF